MRGEFIQSYFARMFVLMCVILYAYYRILGERNGIQFGDINNAATVKSDGDDNDENDYDDDDDKDDEWKKKT